MANRSPGYRFEAQVPNTVPTGTGGSKALQSDRAGITNGITEPVLAIGLNLWEVMLGTQRYCARRS